MTEIDDLRGELRGLTLPQLRKQCKERSLLSTGKKDAVVDRLLEAILYDKTCAQLKKLCQHASLPVAGKKEFLVKRLLEYEIGSSSSSGAPQSRAQKRPHSASSPDMSSSSNKKRKMEPSTPPSAQPVKKVAPGSAPARTKAKREYDVANVFEATSSKSFPTSLSARISRALNQRLYLVDREVVEKDKKEIFKVLGSTGNLYTVNIQTHCSCNCPDSARMCKHIIFVFCRVLKVPRKSPLLLRASVTDAELKQLFASRPAVNDVEAAREVIAAVTGKGLEEEEIANEEGQKEENEEKRKKIEDDDECVICYEDLVGVNPEPLTWCRATCGTNMHAACFKKWEETALGGSVRCPYCRADWKYSPSEEASREKGKGKSLMAGSAYSEGYQNFSHITGQKKSRDYRPWGWNRWGRW
tara:strand:- start:679 stop:1917 length:1239 start_codon:yes stop_codon:yes gene_type:complete